MPKTTDSRLQITSQQLQALNRLAQMVISSMDFDMMLQTILHEAMQMAGAEKGAVLSLSDEKNRPMQTLFKTAEHSQHSLDSAFSDLIGGWVLKNRTPLLLDHFAQDSRFVQARTWFSDVRAVLAVPMFVREEIIGILILTRSESFSQNELELMKIVSTQCAQLLENARNYRHVFRENQQLRMEIERRYDYHGLVGNSPKMQQLYALLQRVIPGEARVLLEGESGTGKELLARIIHYNGPRKEKSFIAVDCGALPETLLESEFFGHVKGAFTGAIADKKGLFECADGGTLFLDEIGNTNPVFQAKLLRAVQEGEIKPVGSEQVRKVDVRIIAATSGRLYEKVKAGEFREDLYYRLNVLNLHLPPLRERMEDIPLLASHFLTKFAIKTKKNCRGFSPKVMRILEKYDWPGNIRELENVIERAVALADASDENISVELLPENLTLFHNGSLLLPDNHANLPQAMEALERYMISDALRHCSGNRTSSADRLGITRQTLISKIKKYALK
ncbi:hypothetical protein A2V82_16095 [candidate division KSB1 bacterium RBG_16_48_16]|nr:MAG: hypothetical protein A2V82_16095 [candidate division KSB1 bacterium RBG_16_48_16]